MKYFVLIALLGLMTDSSAIQLSSMINVSKEEAKGTEKKIVDDPGPDTGVKNVQEPGKSAAQKAADADKAAAKAKGPAPPVEKPKTPEEIETDKKALSIAANKGIMEKNKKLLRVRSNTSWDLPFQAQNLNISTTT